MDLFGDWRNKKKEGIECWTRLLFYDPRDLEEVTSCRVLYKVKLLKNHWGFSFVWVKVFFIVLIFFDLAVGKSQS